MRQSLFPNSDAMNSPSYTVEGEKTTAHSEPAGATGIAMEDTDLNEEDRTPRHTRMGMATRPSFNLTLPKPFLSVSDPTSPPSLRPSPFPTSTPPRPGTQTPWHSLAASSGAPTPSIESGPSMRGNSPHLGYPFERLNIGGSWSGANLFSDAQPVPDVVSPGAPSGPVGGMSLETLSRYRSQAGKTPLEEPGFKLNLPPAMAKVMQPPKAGSAIKPLPKLLSKLQPITTANFKPLVDDPNVLVLDIRPPSSFQTSRVKSSHSLPIPSTLLRRPAFTLSKMVQMLPSPSMEEVARWKARSDIVLIDQDSGTAPEGSIMKGLASKFEREGFSGKLWFLKGGFSAIRSSEYVLEADDETPEITPADEKGLRVGRLGHLAFEQESTGGQAQTPGVPADTTKFGFTFLNNPFDLKTDAAGTSSPSASRSSTSTSNRTARLQPANPFFDNIRQNLELSHGGITERIPLNLPTSSVDRAQEMPNWMAELVKMDEKDSADILARQFYEIELGEQKRLQNVMEWHSRGSGGTLDDDAGRGGKAGNKRTEQRAKDAKEVDRLVAWGEGFEGAGDDDDYFPFSIIAGVERGTKNRYKNIWPYDFSRVRLNSPGDDDSDYINASFVQPRGTAKRYIATQGPLDATYRDFWTLVWEQGVRVIVMLTKQYEGGQLKCGNYWEEQNYGSMRLQLVSHEGGEDSVENSIASGFNFGSHTAPEVKDSNNIKRVFLLRHDEHPDEPPRKIVQIQCVTWPDFDVPETPDVLLQLIKDVDIAVEDDASSSGPDNHTSMDPKPPVLVHCSAGVGRTGSFIIVDAVLDGLRREKVTSEAKTLANEVLSPSTSRGPSSPRPKAPSIVTGGSGGSRSSGTDSVKSVSFLTPATTFKSASEAEAEYLAQTPMPSTSQAAAQDYMEAKGRTGGPMELDTPDDDLPDEPGFRFGFGTDDHREHSEMSVVDDPKFGQWRDDRRPSLASVYSSDRTSYETIPPVTLHRTVGFPRPITNSDVPHRTPSPLSTLENPIAAVLEGMRVQRMSLVQSLRQYLFVHRAIIHHYLSMLDEDKPREEDIHGKRRASPTDLMEGEIREFEDDVAMKRGGSGLSKRPSFKKMRATTAQGISASSNPSIGESPSLTPVKPPQRFGTR